MATYDIFVIPVWITGKQKDLIKEKTWHKVASGTSEDNASSDMQFCFRKKHQLWF